MENVMKNYMRYVFLWLAIAATGCQRGPELAEVTGRVALDNAPLANVRVTFTPLDGPQSFAITDADGRYELMYSEGRKGAVIGSHKVSVEAYRIGRDEQGEIVEYPETLPEKYNLETELSREVVAGSQEINIDLTRE